MINKKIAFGLLLVVVTAGCTGAVPGIGGGNSPIDQVPADAEMVMYLDSDKIQEDQETQALSELGQSAGTPTQDEALDEFEDEADIDPENIDTVTVFASDLKSAQEGGESSGAVIAHGSFDTESVTDYIEEEGSDNLEEEEHNGQTIYVDESEYGQDTAIGILGEGQMVAGYVDSVEEVIDVSAGDEDALSGDLKSEYTDIKGNSLFGMAAEVPDFDDETLERANRGTEENIDLTVFESVEMMSFKYDTPDGEIDMNVGFESGSESDAEDLRSVIDAATIVYEDKGPAEANEEIDKIEVSQDGSSVNVDYQTEVDNIEELQEALQSSTQRTQSGGI